MQHRAGRTSQISGRHGELILLGSPRARLTTDVTPMLSRIHLQGIKMIGALELKVKLKVDLAVGPNWLNVADFRL